MLTSYFPLDESNNTISPQKAAEQMRKIRSDHEDDEEVRHMLMDDFMCEILNNLGYGEVVKIFEDTDKWYA